MTLFDDHYNDPLTSNNPHVSILERDVRMMIETFGYEHVARTVSQYAPAPELRLAQVDAPPTAERAAEKQDSADRARYGRGSIPGELLLWVDRTTNFPVGTAARTSPGDGDVVTRDDAVTWWAHQHPEATRQRLDTVRRRFDELVQIGHLQEVDLTGRVRTVRLHPIHGVAAVANLRVSGWSKPKAE